MNIGIVNTFSHTKSTGKISFGLYNRLSQHNKVFLFYGEPNEPRIEDPNVVLLNNSFQKKLHIYLSALFGNQGMHSFLETKKLIKILKKEKIECVYLLNIHGYFLNYKMLFKFLAKAHIRVIYVMLDEHAFLGKCCFSFDCEKYKTGCKKCPLLSEYPPSLFFDQSSKLFRIKQGLYEKLDNVVFVGIPFIIDKARESLLLKDKNLYTLEEGVDLKRTYYPREISELRTKLCIKNGQIVFLLVAPFSNERKGGKYFLELAKHFADDERYVFVNVGFDGDSTICPSNFIPVKYVENQNELAEYYSLADCFVCTSLAETVANACLEALSCGTPILGFSNSGLPVSVREEHCIFVESKNLEALIEAVGKVKQKDKTISNSCRKYAEEYFDLDNYLSSLESLNNAQCEADE